MTRRRAFTAAVTFLLALTPATATPAEGAATAATTPLAGFVVANDGRLYRAPAPGGSSGGGLTQASSTVVGPPGAAISTVRQSNGAPALFLIGAQGGLVAATNRATAPGLTFFNVGPGGLAMPGGKVSAVTAPDGVHVFFPGLNGGIYDVSFGSQVKPQPVPYLVSLPGLAPSSASIAAGWDSTGPGALFVGLDGALYSVGRSPTGWTTSTVSPPGVAPPGGGVAVLSGQDPMLAFFAGNDAVLWKTAGRPYPEPWQPQAISAAGAITPGAQLAATHLGPRPDPWQGAAVFFAATNGAITVAADLGSGWLAPAATTPPGVARPGAALSIASDSGDQNLYVAWCGNDSLWWWLRWRKLVPPPPPPPWYGEPYMLRPPVSIQPGANTSAAVWEI